MSKRITFWGASDDLVVIEGAVPGCDEYAVYSPATSPDGMFQIRGGGCRMNVACLYGASGGTWCFAPALVDEGEGFPDWPMTISACDIGGHRTNPYSTILVIDVPDDAEVVLLPAAD